MLVGEDYPKIAFEMFGLELLEPMAFVTDGLLSILGFYCAYRISKFPLKNSFNRYWFAFFLIIGMSTFLGGLAHLFYNYFGTYGKIPSWILAPMSMYCLEQGVLATHDRPKIKSLLIKISKIKYVVVTTAWLIILLSVDLGDPAMEKKPFLPIALGAGLGATYCGIVLCYNFSRRLHPDFKFFFVGTAIAFPSIFLVVLRIHPHQWFNGEDLGHVLMMITYILTYVSIYRLNKNYLKD